MTTRTLLAAVLLAASASPAFGQQTPQPAAATLIDAAGWLAGCWELRVGDRVTAEMWLPPAGGLMVGAGRTVVGGAARAFEHLRLQQDGDRLIYTAIPSGQRETVFTSTSVSDTLLVVENPQHDFPQRIIYRRNGDDAIGARIEGAGPDGATRGFDIPLRRVSCTVPARAP